MSQAGEHDLTISYLSTLAETLTFFQEVNKPGYYFDAKVRERSLSVRQSSDVLLTSAVDDFLFSLSIDVADASEKNGAAITALLDGEVNRIRELAALSSGVDSVIALSLTGATAPDGTAMLIIQDKLTTAAEKLAGISAVGGTDLEVFIVQIAAEADPEKGMIALHRDAYQARARAAQISNQAAKDVHAISERAASYGEVALEEITESGRALETEIAQANSNLKFIAIG